MTPQLLFCHFLDRYTILSINKELYLSVVKKRYWKMYNISHKNVDKEYNNSIKHNWHNCLYCQLHIVTMLTPTKLIGIIAYLKSCGECNNDKLIKKITIK